MKYFFIFCFCISFSSENSAQISPNIKTDPISFYIKFSEFQKQFLEQDLCLVESVFTNNSKDTIYYIDYGNSFLGAYISNHRDFDIWRPDFTGPAIPVKNSISPGSSICAYITIRWLNPNSRDLRIGFDFIKLGKNEPIAPKSGLLYQRSNIIWSNTLQVTR